MADTASTGVLACCTSLDVPDGECLSTRRRTCAARASRVLASLFLLCTALGGAIGDPLNGLVFDLVDSYRALFLLMTCYTVLAFVAVLFIPRGTGEADTGSDDTR